ncbi:coiled-coil domain-containing protein 62 isoform X2 [Gopherus flavomarginatus]|uniref:coiled-coil domain-containing protein 62 isoform X2 n=1 Tax=Gopherus flavomarginatus TaxID=286002 RepID=UPI0021CC2AC4|nr:coiled-coil domain-containing protein 62 isoform X2 [Gopherus flavomarginatus]
MNSSLPHSASPQNPSPDLESSTIQKQRKELQLLLAELKDRDKELNDMVAVHQRQLLAWEDDRQKILTLAERCSRLENELHKRNEMIRTLTQRLKVLESQQNDRRTTLENTQQKLQELSQKATDATLHCQALEEKNQSLNCSVLELSAKIGQLQAREQELITMLKLKDKDILEATNHITEFTSKFKKLESALRTAKMAESSINKEKQDFKLRLKQLTFEMNKLKDGLSEKTKENNEQREEIMRLKQENSYLKNELLLNVEKANRQDQLLQSAKSKQVRTNTELSNLRQIYVKQQHDLQFLHFNLESSQELWQKHKEEAHKTKKYLNFIDSEEHVDLNSFYLDSPCLTSTQKRDGPQKCERFFDADLPSEISNLSVIQSANKCTSPTINCDSCSPTSKLQRLLAESRQMVADLELSMLLHISPCCSPSSSSVNMTTELTEALCKVQLPAMEESETKLSLFSL